MPVRYRAIDHAGQVHESLRQSHRVPLYTFAVVGASSETPPKLLRWASSKRSALSSQTIVRRKGFPSTQIVDVQAEVL